MSYLNTNDLAYAIAARAKELANKTLPELRYANPDNIADTYSGAQRDSKHLNRGELIELILEEEFVKEFPDPIGESDVLPELKQS